MPDSSKKHEAAHFAPHTRESLEGAVAKPLDLDEKNLKDLTSGGAERLEASAKRVTRHEAPAPARKGRVPFAAKVLIVLLAVIGVVAGGLWAWVSGIEGEMRVRDEDRADLEDALVTPGEQSAADQASNAFYVLIIGSDAREGESVSRSDVIMLARVDTDAPSITLVSIPRDTMIYRGDGAIEKINAEYNYGPGPTVRAVSELAGVDIAHYVEVNFDGMKDVVDALGGVTVNIPEDITAGNGGISLSKGEQVLSGDEALAYARERYNATGGDFGRAQAQRQIVEAIVREVLSSSPVEMPGLVTKLAQAITTDLSAPDIISYALALQQAGGSLTTYSAACPSYTLNQDGVSYVATMYAEWREMMQRVDAGLDPNDESAEIPDAQRENERLGATTNAAGPKDYEDLAENALTTDDVAH